MKRKDCRANCALFEIFMNNAGQTKFVVDTATDYLRSIALENHYYDMGQGNSHAARVLLSPFMLASTE